MVSLHYQFRVGRQTVSNAVEDVCNAIYKRLMSDYLKVCSTNNQHCDLTIFLLSYL